MPETLPTLPEPEYTRILLGPGTTKHIWDYGHGRCCITFLEKVTTARKLPPYIVQDSVSFTDPDCAQCELLQVLFLKDALARTEALVYA